jgi:hypothetical protein
MMTRRQNPGSGISAPKPLPRLGLASLTFLVVTGAARRAHGFEMGVFPLQLNVPFRRLADAGI